MASLRRMVLNLSSCPWSGRLPVGPALVAAVSGLLLQQPLQVHAQDITTPNGYQGFGTVVTPSGGGNYTITGGTESGTKLLHGFETFNIPEGGSASFDGTGVTAPIQSIYGVISTEASALDGALQVVNFNNGLSTPSLFLMNPNGFVLGTGFSTNVQQLSLFAVDGILLGCPIGATLCSNANNVYPVLTVATDSTDVGSQAWLDSNRFVGLLSDASLDKVIEIAAADLTVSELSLAAAIIDFQPGSSVSIKSLNVFAQWFNGATTGPFADIAYGSFTSTPNTGSIGTFAPDPTVAAVDPLLSTDNMLLDSEALYTPTTYFTWAPGTVFFDGVIQSEPVAYLLGTRQLSADQAVIKVLAKQTSISAVDSPGGLTSPFGPYAGVSNSQATSYGGLYYGFGATIEIDPAINEAQYISDPFADFLAAYGEEAAEDVDLYAADGLDGFEDTSEEDSLAWSDDSGDSDGDGYSDEDQDLVLDADAFDLADGGDGFAPSEQGADGTASGVASDGTVAAAPAVPTVAVSTTEATNNFNSTELSSLQQTAGALGLGSVQALSPQQAQQALQQAIQAVRGQQTVGARGADAGALIAAAGVRAPATLPQQFNRAAYNPAIVQLRFTEAKGRTAAPDSDAFLDITLIPAAGAVIGKRVEVSTSGFVSLLKDLYRQLSRQEDLGTRNPGSAARRLYSMLLAPLEQELDGQKITTLLIGADRGLQGVPYAALHSGRGFLGERFAFALTPSLSLTNLTPVPSGEKRLLAAGASRFDGLAPLPLVPEELRAIGASQPSDVFLNAEFTTATLEVAAAEPRYDRIHLATHAEFLPGGPTSARLYSGQGSMSLASLANLRTQRRGVPLDLIVFSACRTALGDADSELGFAGLALQAGARSAIGTLWYVDDVATSVYFIQAYRYLQQGIPKAEALQFTRRDFATGRVQLTGDQIIGGDGQVLLSGLTIAQQRRIGSGLANPFYWAGIELLGAPW